MKIVQDDVMNKLFLVRKHSRALSGYTHDAVVSPPRHSPFLIAPSCLIAHPSSLPSSTVPTFNDLLLLDERFLFCDQILE